LRAVEDALNVPNLGT